MQIPRRRSTAASSMRVGVAQGARPWAEIRVCKETQGWLSTARGLQHAVGGARISLCDG